MSEINISLKSAKRLLTGGKYCEGDIVVTPEIPDGYVQPSGTRKITVNGTYDVSGYASVIVSVGDILPSEPGA